MTDLSNDTKQKYKYSTEITISPNIPANLSIIFLITFFFNLITRIFIYKKKSTKIYLRTVKTTD